MTDAPAADGLPVRVPRRGRRRRGLPRSQTRQWILRSALVAVAARATCCCRRRPAAGGAPRCSSSRCRFAAVGGLLAAQLTGGVLERRRAGRALRRRRAGAAAGAGAGPPRAGAAGRERRGPRDAMRRSVRENAAPVLAVALAAAALLLPAAVIGGRGAGAAAALRGHDARRAGHLVAVVLVVVPGLYPALAGLQPACTVDGPTHAGAPASRMPRRARPGRDPPSRRARSGHPDRAGGRAMSRGRASGLAALLVAGGSPWPGARLRPRGGPPPAAGRHAGDAADGGPGIITLSQAADDRLAVDDRQPVRGRPPAAWTSRTPPSSTSPTARPGCSPRPSRCTYQRTPITIAGIAVTRSPSPPGRRPAPPVVVRGRGRARRRGDRHQR